MIFQDLLDLSGFFLIFQNFLYFSGFFWIFQDFLDFSGFFYFSGYFGFFGFLNVDTLIIQYNAAIRKEGGSPERDGGEGEGLVLEYSSSWISLWVR